MHREQTYQEKNTDLINDLTHRIHKTKDAYKDKTLQRNLIYIICDVQEKKCYQLLRKHDKYKKLSLKYPSDSNNDQNPGFNMSNDLLYQKRMENAIEASTAIADYYELSLEIKSQYRDEALINLYWERVESSDEDAGKYPKPLPENDHKSHVKNFVDTFMVEMFYCNPKRMDKVNHYLDNLKDIVLSAPQKDYEELHQSIYWDLNDWEQNLPEPFIGLIHVNQFDVKNLKDIKEYYTMHYKEHKNLKSARDIENYIEYGSKNRTYPYNQNNTRSFTP